MSKTPNLRQPSTGPTIYPAMKLPPMVTIPTAINPHMPNRPNTSPLDLRTNLRRPGHIHIHPHNRHLHPA
jgi:hypothetical protein